MARTVVISEGYSNSYLVPGSFLLILGLSLSFITFYFLLLMLPAVCLFSATTGLEIDGVEKRVRKYSAFFNFRRGIWLPLKFFTGAELGETVVNYAHRTFFRYNRSTSRTFDVVLLRSDDGDPYCINDFFEYSDARKGLLAIADTMQWKAVDHYAEETARLKLQKRR